MIEFLLRVDPADTFCALQVFFQSDESDNLSICAVQGVEDCERAARTLTNSLLITLLVLHAGFDEATVERWREPDRKSVV